MKNFFPLLGTLCFLFASTEAAQNIEIDSTNLLRCTLSSRHHNRISVDGQRIKKVIYPEGDVSIRMEEDSGQIFVQAMVDFPSETTATIITNCGVVQDLEFSFADKASEILILREKIDEENVDFSGLIAMDCGDEINAIQDVIEKMLSGTILEEYIPVEDRQICCRIKREVILKSSMRLVGPLYTIYVLTLENKGRRLEKIHEREINFVAGEWIFIEKNELDRGDKALVLMGVKTYEQQ